MAKQQRNIYLAGKVNGIKHEFAKRINAPHIKFLCSDGGNHSEHDWGYSTWDYSDKVLGELVQKEFIEVIPNCEMVVAVLNTADSYGSIAEVAYASAIGVPSMLIIYDKNEAIGTPMQDAYWFVSNFPHVHTVCVKDDEEAAAMFSATVLMESAMEFLFFFVLRHKIPEMAAKLQPQAPFFTGEFTYRVDFLYEREKRKIAVEIDGHDSHKTREQRTHDARKDRFLKSIGVEVVRFTGTELNADAMKCIQEFFYLVFPELQK